MTDSIHQRADRLVTLVGESLAAGNRPLAVKLAEQMLSGVDPGSEALEKLKRNGQPPDLRQQVWDAAKRVFRDDPRRDSWRSLCGRLVRTCGLERALEALREAQGKIDPRSYLGAVIKQGEHGPLWKLDADGLAAEAERLGVSTYGKTNEQLKDAIEAGRRRELAAREGEAGLGADLLRSA